MKKNILFTIFILFIFVSCNDNHEIQYITESISSNVYIKEVNLEANLESFSDDHKQMIKLFIKASIYTDSIFFYQNLDNYNEVYNKIEDVKLQEKFVANFGPWCRFNENISFIEGIENKPLGGNFYPLDLTVSEFQDFENDCKNSHYTLIRRDSSENLICIPYYIQYQRFNDSICSYLMQAAELSENKNFSEYLIQRAKDIQNDNYFKSDSLWLQLQDNNIDFIVGPLQILDDNLFNLKAENQSFLLIKDVLWTEKMLKYNKWLQFLQKAIPVPEAYRAEDPGSNSSIVVYDIIYFGGSGRAGGALLSTVLPIETETQISEGVKNIQFKNIISSKFEAITKPISEIVLTNSQKEFVSADAFVIGIILYEMANSLGIRNTINGKGTVRYAFKDYYTISSYLKNYVLSLFLAEKLNEVDELECDLKDIYTTFVVNRFRLIRYGMNNDYAITNLVCYNYLVENNAIEYDKNNHIIINYDEIKIATENLAKEIIILQGDGNYKGIKIFIDNYTYIDKNLFDIITIINNKKVPTDILINQGGDYLKF